MSTGDWQTFVNVYKRL